MTDLERYRQEIDRIDKELVALWEARTLITDTVGLYKKERGINVLDRSREEAVLEVPGVEGFSSSAGLEVSVPGVEGVSNTGPEETSVSLPPPSLATWVMGNLAEPKAPKPVFRQITSPVISRRSATFWM